MYTENKSESRYPGFRGYGAECRADKSVAKADGRQGPAVCAIPGAYGADNDSTGCILSIRPYGGIFCGGGGDLYGRLPEDGAFFVRICGVDRCFPAVSGRTLSHGCDRRGDRGCFECLDRAQDCSSCCKRKSQKEKIQKIRKYEWTECKHIFAEALSFFVDMLPEILYSTCS